MGGAPILGGRHLKGRRDNQPIDGVGGGGGTGEAMRTGGTRGGGLLPTNQVANGATKKIKKERAAGPRILMASAAWDDATTNQKSALSLRYI
jgi:hypothetical protein